MKAKATIFTGLVVSLALGGAFAWSEWNGTGMEASERKPAPSQSEESKPARKGGSAGELKKVLPAGDFFGQGAIGYAAAAQCPEILAKLFCYCGCDLTDDHTSLLDCFTSKHGAECPICTDEAVIAAEMKKSHKTLGQIQLAIDTKFAYEYIYTEPSPALKKYRATALGAKASANTGASTPKLKPGKLASTCCK